VNSDSDSLVRRRLLKNSVVCAWCVCPRVSARQLWSQFPLFKLKLPRLSRHKMYNSTVVDVVVQDHVSYLTIYDWEHINLAKCRRWMERNWTLSVYASLAYICLIFVGQVWMRNREPFQLRKLLLVWNIALAAFSIFGFLRTVPELLYITQVYGYHNSICSR